MKSESVCEAAYCFFVFFSQFSLLTLKRCRSQGRIQDFFRRGCTCLLLYFNTNKPHSFFLQNTSSIRKLQVISGGGRGMRIPCTLPLDPPLETPNNL